MNSSSATQESMSDPIPSLTKSKQFWGRAVWISAIAVVIPPLLGVAGTVVGMLRAFENIGQTGKANSEVMAENVSVALWTTMVGLLISSMALLVFIVTLIFFLKRRQSLRTMVEDIPPTR